MSELSHNERRFIEEAALHLEFPTWVQRLASLAGKPVEMTLQRLPEAGRRLVSSAAEKAMASALTTALGTLKREPVIHPFEESCRLAGIAGRRHNAGSALTGAVGGFFGFAALPLELPLTTVVMLRSISNIASCFGHDLGRRETQLDCLYVFSLGGPGASQEMGGLGDTTYYSTRVAFAEVVNRALAFVASKSAREVVRAVETRSAPALVDLVLKVSSRFELVAGRKTLAQLIPGIGAGAGALINAAFTDHFNQIARYHFGLRRLEAEAGELAVKRIYDEAFLRQGPHLPSGQKN